MKMSYETLNLTGPCFEALNATVECSDRLAKHVAWDASSVDLLDQDGLANVCEATCRQSLVDLRTKVLDSCDASADTIQYSYLSFPATYIVDRYLYFYDVSCYKDKSTGSFCDTVVAGWRNETGGSEAHYCDDCWLGPMSVQLRSPIGFNEDRASEFASLTRSCSIDAYATPTPTPYGEATATFGDVVTTAQASMTDAATATATATEVTSAEEMMPSIYPLLEVGTAASVDAQEGKENTRKQRRNRSKKASAQSLARQVNPHAPGTSEDCPKYQSFLPFELTYRKADQNKEFLDDFGINGCGYTATKHGITRS
ncbi:hypothetical protein K4K49_006502 [Colletotrichum sp. SAR 10_70]|nr:hypothetical protein K4K50_001026 [Colletotrichum sp. SAR 10_71]KAI8190619.1 hypothetical protein K4K51_001494 [Colletotrichum sp. SAR 10_75]KAI8196593.1 hypothetical protein K4K49_006502 [Colletotrichum sp. SAR 10_70]